MEFIGVETLVVYTPTRDSFEVLVGRLVAMLRSVLTMKVPPWAVLQLTLSAPERSTAM